MRDFCKPWRRKVGYVSKLGVGFLFGWNIWLASPFITGQPEPWDAQGWYYSVTTFVAGAVSATMWDRKAWQGPLSVYIGQVTFCWVFLSRGVPILPAPIAIAVFGTLQLSAGATLGWAIRLAIRKIYKNFPIPPDAPCLPPEPDHA